MNILNISQQPGRTAISNGKEYLFFSGYAYLGMNHVPEFTELVKEGIDKYGLLFPSSRISNTRLTLFEEAEALLSQVTSAEDTVLASSGFTAGKLATQVFNQAINNMPNSHPAIRLNNPASSSDNIKKIIATDAVNPLTATVTDFSFLKENNPAVCIVDDSHGFGLLGDRGEGISSSLPLNNDIEYVLTYSLSKACNLIGGAVSCTKETADKIRTLPEYTAGTAPSPAFLHAFIKGQHLYKKQREKLRSNISYFQSLIKNIPGIAFDPQLPMFILPSTIDENKFIENSIIISSFAYPDPTGKKVQRIVLNALHTREDMERVIECLQQNPY